MFVNIIIFKVNRNRLFSKSLYPLLILIKKTNWVSIDIISNPPKNLGSPIHKV